VGVRGDRIAAIGNLSMSVAKRRVEAKGKAVLPGFIDLHSHASWRYLVDPRALSKLTQGVTLEIGGEGHSVAPMDAAAQPRQQRSFDRFAVKPDWGSLGALFNRLEREPGAINFATYVGTATVREQVVGFDDRPATTVELERMRAVVDEAMRDGALGVYSALMYSPDRFNRSEELIAMAKVAAKYGGTYQTHPRSESTLSTPPWARSSASRGRRRLEPISPI
jgi:dihydroorotase/N-acyl-D-amino-acid deacylase